MDDKSRNFEPPLSAQEIWFHLQFIRDHWNSPSPRYTIEKLRSILCIPATDGKLYFASYLYFPDIEIFKEADLYTTIPHVEGGDKGEKKWRDFLAQLGVHSLPRIIEGYDDEPNLSPEFEQLWKYCRTSKKGPSSPMEKLLSLINTNWDYYLQNGWYSPILQLLEPLKVMTTHGRTGYFDESFAAGELRSIFGKELPYLQVITRINTIYSAELVMDFLAKGECSDIRKWEYVYQVLASKRVAPKYYVYFIATKGSNKNNTIKREPSDDDNNNNNSTSTTTYQVIIKKEPTNLVWDGDKEIASLSGVRFIAEFFPSLRNYFTKVGKVRPSLFIGDYLKALRNIFWNREETKHVSFEMRKQMEPLLLKIYKAIDEEIASP